MEEEMRWMLNRGRFNPAMENATRGTNYQGLPPIAGPLAPNYSITAAARRHAEDLARRNLLQHFTVPGSLFYNPVTQPNPSSRMIAEGFSGWAGSTENAAAGRSTALENYLAYWGSAIHRGAMYSHAYREIGTGYFRFPGSSWEGHRHVMDLAASANGHFFTGTIFHDSNGNRVYETGEGRGGVRVDLRVNGGAHTHFDVSTPVGSFAVPIGTIPGNAFVEVLLTNTGTAVVHLSIPRNYHDLHPLVLGPGQQVVWGSFTKIAVPANLGFRNLSLVNQPVLTAPGLSVRVEDGMVILSWLSQPGLRYQVRWSETLDGWTNVGAPLNGNGTVLTASEPMTHSSGFYQVVVTGAP